MMKSLKLVASAAPVLAAMTLLPVLSFAADSHSCASEEPTAQSYTWNFSREAAGILKDLRADAVHAEAHAATLQSMASANQVSWEAHASELSRIKYEINDMGAKLCRLETIRRVVSPWEQQAIDRSVPEIRLLADNATDALNYLNQHQGEFWEPTYVKYTDNLYNESHQLNQSVRNFEEYAKARSKELKLQKSLEIKAGA